MSKAIPKKKVTDVELNKAFQRRKRQLAFDNYPKSLQEFMTRIGMNPYEEESEERIQYRDFTVTVKEK